MTMFTLLNLASSETVERAVYEDGKRAAKIAARLTRMTGRKYQVRKLTDGEGDANWREREQARFTSGDYIPLVDYLKEISPPDFFGHIAKKSPELIAYTKDEQRGRMDKQSLLSISAYLNLCLTHPSTQEKLELWTRQAGYTTVAEYVTEYYSARRRTGIAEEQLKYATELMNPVKFAGPLPENFTPDDVEKLADQIEKIYTTYDSTIDSLAVSCMRADASEYRGRVDGDYCHPTRAYASPDLAIAYMTDNRGRTIARALCWPQRKIYSRVYASSNALHVALQSLGYVKSGYYGAPSRDKSFAGARMRRIEHDRGGFVVPYIDDCSSKYVDDAGDWLLMVGDEINCEVTGGVAEGPSTALCGHCGDECDEDDMTRVYINSRRDDHEGWCQHCVDRSAFYCNGYDAYFCDDLAVDSTEVDGQTYSLRYVEDNASFCEYYEEYTFDSMYEVVVSDCGDTQTWSENACSDNAFRYAGRYYSNDLEHVEVVTERYVPHIERTWIGSVYKLCPVNLWFVDKTVIVPQSMIDEGDVDAYLGVDGRHYMRDYIDHYPVDRPRVAEDAPVILSWYHTYCVDA